MFCVIVSNVCLMVYFIDAEWLNEMCNLCKRMMKNDIKIKKIIGYRFLFFDNCNFRCTPSEIIRNGKWNVFHEKGVQA